MPVYVYKNLTTGATFEVAQRITEAALTVDPASGHPVKRLIQPVGIAFKGSGFYVTDSRKSSKGAPKGDAPKADAPASAPSDASASTPAPVTKPAATPTAAGD
jgi:predicted nucleic acid-binding Zn ribbon protein